MAEQDTATLTDIHAAPEFKPKPQYIWGVGRRKSAVARVRIAPGSGKIEINGRTLNEYLTAERDRNGRGRFRLERVISDQRSAVSQSQNAPNEGDFSLATLVPDSVKT